MAGKAIVRPVFRSTDDRLAPGIWDPRLLFVKGEQGVLYDPSDLSTLFKDAAGTIPVTADGDPVGLMLDKSQGLELGLELVTNGGFDTDSFWAKGAGWSIAGGAASHAVGTGGDITQDISSISGRFYRISYTVSNISSGSVQPKIGLSSGIPRTTNGTFSEVIIAGSSDTLLRLTGGTSFDGSITNISVRELKGNHATQSVAAQRPTFDDAPPSVIFDAVDDNHITSLPDLGADVTIAYASPGVGPVIQTGQAISAGNYVWDTNHAGLIIVDRALTPAETTAVTAYLKTKAGV